MVLFREEVIGTRIVGAEFCFCPVLSHRSMIGSRRVSGNLGKNTTGFFNKMALAFFFFT